MYSSFLFNTSVHVDSEDLEKELFFLWPGGGGCFILADIERMAYGT